MVTLVANPRRGNYCQHLFHDSPSMAVMLHTAFISSSVVQHALTKDTTKHYVRITSGWVVVGTETEPPSTNHHHLWF